MDIDLVIDLELLTDTQAYHTLEENLEKMGFVNARNDRQQPQFWRWETRTESGQPVTLDLLADAPEIAGGRVQPLPTGGKISALNIPHSSIVFDLFQEAEIRAELLSGSGIAVERIRHADIVSFTCLKAFAFDQRFEGKDAYDLIYCLEHAAPGVDSVIKAFSRELKGKHSVVVQASLAILRSRFTSDEITEGYRKDGPVAVAKFELGEDPGDREARTLRQREASDVCEQLLSGLR
ncbi:MAG: hypothetical protein LBE83_06760 [Propionibacteriaceae bacterium]|nr:hypothetical protein [Propionibacteriaceae bacterium]